MKQQHKRFFAGFCAAICSAACLPLSAGLSADGAETSAVLAIGDSIAYGYGLEDSDYRYAQYAADYLDASYENLAINGQTTPELLARLTSTDEADETAQAMQTSVQQADYIFISTGGNDLLQPALDKIYEWKVETEGEGTGSSTAELLTYVQELDTQSQMALVSELSAVVSEAEEQLYDGQYLPQLVDVLTALNPDAELVFQTVYNPLISTEAIYNGVDYTTKLNLVSAMMLDEPLDALNDQLLNLASQSEQVTVADVYTAFMTFESSALELPFDRPCQIYTLIGELDIHPNAFGHAVIGMTVIDALGLEGGSCPQFRTAVEALSEEDAVYVPAAYLTRMEALAGSAELDFTLGDVNTDGSVDSDDAVSVLKAYTASMLNGETGLTEAQTLAADVTLNSQIDSDDAVQILKYYAKVMLEGSADWGAL